MYFRGSNPSGIGHTAPNEAAAGALAGEITALGIRSVRALSRTVISALHAHLLLLLLLLSVAGFSAGAFGEADSPPKIALINPPEKGFFAKHLDFHGIPIKAPEVVVDDALYAAYARLSMLLSNQPVVVLNLAAAGAELHIIGRNQVTTDLPEWRRDKGKHLAEYRGLTRDQRTRGMGGLLTSCGEENLLNLETDRYHGRDICLHEFSHNIRNHGITREVRAKFDALYHRSLEKGLWQKSYAGSNPDEFFAELTMWYFGTHGDLHMNGPKPENGPEGLKKYDPEAFALFDEFYRGRINVPKVERPFHGHSPEDFDDE